MLHLQQGQTSEFIVLTLQEKQTLTEDYLYKFVFIHGLTKRNVTFFKSSADDSSTYPSRYNEFEIDTADVFEGEPPGEWLYTVYETTILEVVTVPLEYGKMYLLEATEFEPTKYEQATSYTAYQRG
jgi:hypothetical protein